MSDVPKTQACKLIEALCDNIEGSVTFIANLSCSAINLALQGSANAEILEPSILQWQEDPFFKSDPVLIAETCMLVCTVISYILP